MNKMNKMNKWIEGTLNFLDRKLPATTHYPNPNNWVERLSKKLPIGVKNPEDIPPEQLKIWQERWGGSWARPKPEDVWFKMLGFVYLGIFVGAIVAYGNPMLVFNAIGNIFN